MRKEIIKKAWAAIDFLYAHHINGLCTDDSPNGWDYYGCNRCDAIIGLEIGRGLKIWPRNSQTVLKGESK